MGIHHTNMHTMSWGFTIPICIQCHGDLPYQYAYNVMGIYHTNMHIMSWGFTIPICIQCYGDLPYQYAYNVMGIYHTNMHTMSWGFTIPICILVMGIYHGICTYWYGKSYNVCIWYGIYHTIVCIQWSWGFPIPYVYILYGDLPYNMHTMVWGFPIHCMHIGHGDLPMTICIQWYGKSP